MQARRFHDLPDDHKATALDRAQGAKRGWIPLGTEPAYEAGTIARCESFDLAMELPGESSTQFGGLGANVWPDDLPGFQETIYTWYLDARYEPTTQVDHINGQVSAAVANLD